MRLTIELLGHTFDLSLGPTASEAEDEADPLRDFGATGGTYVGFTAAHDVPADLPWVERDNGWGDEEWP
jgi:hypothetical protein